MQLSGVVPSVLASNPLPQGRQADGLAAKKKREKTMASLSPGAQEAMAGVTTIMNAKLEALTYAVNCTIRRLTTRQSP